MPILEVTVRTVALPGFRKGPKQADPGLHRRIAQQHPGHPADADRARRVGAGRPHHHRSQNIKNVQHCAPPCPLWFPVFDNTILPRLSQGIFPG